MLSTPSNGYAIFRNGYAVFRNGYAIFRNGYAKKKKKIVSLSAQQIFTAYDQCDKW